MSKKTTFRKARKPKSPEEKPKSSLLEKETLTSDELLTIIEQAHDEEWEKLDLSGKGITELIPDIGKLSKLKYLDLGIGYLQDKVLTNNLSSLPNEIGKLKNLRILDISNNKLTSLPQSISQLQRLTELELYQNLFMIVPEPISQLTNLETLRLGSNQLTSVPEWIGQLINLKALIINRSQIQELPISLAQLKNLRQVFFGYNNVIPEELGLLIKLEILSLHEDGLRTVPNFVRRLTNLRVLLLNSNQLSEVPEWIDEFKNLENLWLQNNLLRSLPPSIARLENLGNLQLQNNPLNPALKSANSGGIGAVRAFLGSLAKGFETLFEAKLILVGEGGVGKTTLLKALSGKEPKKGEVTTHGVSVDVNSMYLQHPINDSIMFQFNAWDFGGQEVYRVTHQFFFSKRSVYLIVWEPRIGVEQSQVEDWLKLIRLRVGNDAKVIIVSTHAKTGQRIARIDKPVFFRDYGSMIVDFIEVDSLESDADSPNEKYNIPKLKNLIANAAKDLEQMGMPFATNWKAARDELVELGKTMPRVSYTKFSEVCARYELDKISTKTLSGLMHDLGYIVYYGDDDRMKDDVVLQPEWLTKAISFVLEDRATQERGGILPDSHLEDVWLKHNFKEEPHYDKELYPFFLRLMEKYDVSYRLQDSDASLVAQHVPQVRPNLPWQPDEVPKENQRRLGMVCVMDEAPPGLVPWMIVRTHDYAYELDNHRLHWQKGMFLSYKEHGESMLELRDREFHIYTQAFGYPEFFANVLRQTLQKLINDNWPGLEGHYHFAVPCKTSVDGNPCKGRFRIDALAIFAQKGLTQIPCQVCYEPQDIMNLLYGFEEENPREQLSNIQAELVGGFADLKARLDGLESRISNYVMAIMRAMANEAKEGPRLFTLEPTDGNWHRVIKAKYRIHLWCEAEGCQHPVTEKGGGVYEFKSTREWVRKIAPYANFLAGMLKTIVPMITPAVDTIFGAKTIEKLNIGDHLSLMSELVSNLPEELKISDSGGIRDGILSDDERSGLLALHSLLKELDPQQKKIGLRRVPTYTGDFAWVCKKHYDLMQPKIPEKIE
ncbi:MAG: hypothetical protein H7Y59_10360 [Anaerolineales bacterium]|nr:hypothetical protein [Anaerolineales bacterium]